MGYYFANGTCANCRRFFSFNPNSVPNIRLNDQRIPDPQGTKEPLCEDCVYVLNKIRKEKGIELIYVPPGAYEPVDDGMGEG